MTDWFSYQKHDIFYKNHSRPLRQFRTQNEAPTMVWARKKDTSEEMSYLVDQTTKISNLLEDLKKVERFMQYIENQGSENLTEIAESQE